MQKIGTAAASRGQSLVKSPVVNSKLSTAGHLVQEQLQRSRGFCFSIRCFREERDVVFLLTNQISDSIFCVMQQVYASIRFIAEVNKVVNKL